ncbi:MAG: PLP-dependent transferase [Clostridiales bacterium]|nr:PLP-dependent transferase [Clostridiales bacterium]
MADKKGRINREYIRTAQDICTHLGDDYDRFFGAVVPPIFQNSLFVDYELSGEEQEGRYNYTRLSNPTIEIAEQKIAALEKGEAALCFSSGMAAISTAIFYWVSTGSHVIMVKNAYSPARNFIELLHDKFGVEFTLVSGEKLEEYERSIRPNTKLIYLETPSSLVFTLQDLESVAKLAKSYGIATIVDNSWATPIFQNPLEFGIDMVVHSASKYLAGHSDIIGGVIVSRKDIIHAIQYGERCLLGGIMDPHQAWLLIRGLRTLPVRMKQHQESALEIAQFLEQHPVVERVLYPGLKSHPQYELGKKQMKGYSGVLGFITKGNPDKVLEFVDSLQYFKKGPSWGGFESLIAPVGVGMDEETSKKTGIPIGTIRISVGLESVDTLIDCLDRGLVNLSKNG